MQKIYVVVAKWNTYYEYTIKIVASYSTEEQAKIHVKLASEFNKNNPCKNNKIVNPYDNIKIRSGGLMKIGVSYDIKEIDLLQNVEEYSKLNS